MPYENPVDLTQDINNKLTEYANAERSRLLPKNEYSDDVSEYSSVNPNAIADGDSKGRGTGVFLDVYNEKAGTREDIIERKSMLKINKWKSTNQYPDF
jgi:hypothetical protein